MSPTEPKLLPAQRRTLAALMGGEYPNVLYQGGLGSGKTWVGAYASWLLMCEGVIPIRHLIMGGSYPQLRDSSQRAWFEIGAAFGWDKWIESYSKSEGRATLANGSEVLFRSAETAFRLKSTEFDSAWLDEAADYDADDLSHVQSRIRRNVTGKRNRTLYTTNPDEKGRFREWAARIESHGLLARIGAPTGENIHLPSDYVANLFARFGGKDSPIARRRIFGEDVRYGGYVYQFTRRDHVTTAPPPQAWDYFAGIDFGWDHPFAYVLCARNGDDYRVIAEHYARHTHLSDHVAAIKQIEEAAGINPAWIKRYADHDAQDVAELRKMGIATINARKEVMRGIETVYGLLAVGPRGRPSLLVSANCPNLIRELEGYEWDEGAKEDRPRKAASGNWDNGPPYTDDAVDALRYALHSHITMGAAGADITGGHERRDYGVSRGEGLIA